jgi:hypothetical protein
MDKKFTALRIIAVVLKVLAWIDAALTVILFLVCLVAGAALPRFAGPYGGSYGAYGAMGGVVMAFTVLILGALYFIGLLAWSDMIYVFLSIEENTRALKPPAASQP